MQHCVMRTLFWWPYTCLNVWQAKIYDLLTADVQLRDGRGTAYDVTTTGSTELTQTLLKHELYNTRLTYSTLITHNCTIKLQRHMWAKSQVTQPRSLCADAQLCFAECFSSATKRHRLIFVRRSLFLFEDWFFFKFTSLNVKQHTCNTVIPPNTLRYMPFRCYALEVM